MVMKRCNNGHFYDSDKYGQCPYCGISNIDASKTMPIIRPESERNSTVCSETVGLETVASPTAASKAAYGNNGKTVGFMQKNKGIDPVVGWLVCIDGPSKGQDYRIKSEKNFIGRAANMDIAITDDDSISRENHAVISFNPKNGCFRLLPGESHGMVYLNDEEVYSASELFKGDVIELGQTKLKFVPFCDGGFVW